MRSGSITSAKKLFLSDEDWPLVLHNEKLRHCLRFLSRGDKATKRLIRIDGPSGTGKTFFTKKMLVSFASENPTAVAIYIDTPAADLEATSSLDKIGTLLQRPREASLKKPQAIPKKISKLWRTEGKNTSKQGAGYIYRVSRDLVAQIPAAGPFIKAVMPATSPLELFGNATAGTPLGFLVGVSRKNPVLLVLDNYQNLPPIIRDSIEAEFQNASPEFRLVAVQRREHWQECYLPRNLDGVEEIDQGFERASQLDIESVISTVFTDLDVPEGFSETIYRRSEGNLKSVWFQLKLFLERVEADGAVQSDHSYENVIQTLSTLDQTILRTVVFLLGGLSISEIATLLGSFDRQVMDADVVRAIADLSTIGLLIVNGDSRDQVRVEHDMVSKIVDELTPEEEKLELRETLVNALVNILNNRVSGDDDDALHDRLIGITHEQEVRQNPSLQSHLVRHLDRQHEMERYTYLATLCRDSVCWQVLDILPSATVRLAFDAIQKCSLFSFGLLTAERLKAHESHASVAWLYEGKFLAQLFKYEEALASLEKVSSSQEKELVEYTIRLNLHENQELKKIAEKTLDNASRGSVSEFDLIILRNSGHLFSTNKARRVVQSAVDGFEQKGLFYGVATARNNLGIIELDDGNLDTAEALFGHSLSALEELESPEQYQPIVNLSGVAVLKDDWVTALSLLSQARSVLPSSLPMDRLMLDYNEAAVLFLSSNFDGDDPVSAFKTIAQLASRTRDTRFVEVLNWFAQCLENTRVDESAPKISPILAEIRSARTARQELFVDFEYANSEIEVPYILSPHWRH